ncbi:GNAT family N-acetyltransferase [Micromonospora thermarum]|uniref:GNAT family N-acetyltransferase n=1 Tax=Micromonospora thermarum TaxID=2720024 RepID=UPI00281559C9|nr:GNAT family N-acetyltransferase [Micromonospora thermarum]
MPAPDDVGPAGPGTLDARRATVFGRPQPVLFATAGEGEVRLRPMEARDVDAIIATCRDADTIRWTTVPDPYDRADAEDYLAYARDAWAAGTSACYAIAGADDGFAGAIDLRLSAADSLQASVGFMTAPHARGRGHMPAALSALAAWGFTTLGLARIEWRANVGNTASRRAAEKAGFRVEGTARAGLNHRGARTDAWVGALLAEDLT